MQRRVFLAGGLMPGLLLRPGRAWAQERFPTRPLRMVVPFAAGGSTDILARICAQWLNDRLGQPVVVENVSGAGGTLGAGRVAEATPDGYTLLAGTPGPITINPILQPRIPYQPLRDLAPVAFVGDSPAVVVVRRQSPIRSIRDLVEQAKAKAGGMTFASSGIGSFAHLCGELFKWRAGLNLTHVPYRGTAPAAADVIAGRVEVMFENYPSVQGYITSGELRPLAIGASRRSALLPQVPTVIEEGVPNYESSSWFGLFAPAAVPPAIIERLNTAINEGLRQPAIATRLIGIGVEPVGGSPAEFQAYVRQRLEEAGQLIRNARIMLE
ncbi:MAG TPA: tripartite tricarboxylate transporter substrate binding protein [Crenalkalicoccus sp.]|jgi:tripartite-type tricarboxylate transporter receptor subunit TctC|nr:tripartite tricarboxylate transporter substrate binding protein [Crenalkalicoccus sp.]